MFLTLKGLHSSKELSNSHNLRVRKVGSPPLFGFVSLSVVARKWSNQNLPGALHFVTGNFLNRTPVFDPEGCCQSFIDKLGELLNDWPSKLIAYVLIPGHLHLIVNHETDELENSQVS